MEACPEPGLGDLDVGENRINDVVGVLALRLRLVGHYDPMAQHIVGDALHIVGTHIAAAA